MLATRSACTQHEKVFIYWDNCHAYQPEPMVEIYTSQFCKAPYAR